LIQFHKNHGKDFPFQKERLLLYFPSKQGKVIMKEILKTVIKDWQRTFPRAEVWERNLQVPLDSQKIISLIGPRRCGKTYYVYQLINQLLARGPNAKFIYWEKFVRRMYDTVTKNIFLTGSSAKMLGKEIATSLRGRNLVYHLFPLSFEEYCRFQNLDVKLMFIQRMRGPF
jgi:hypothetical protein